MAYKGPLTGQGTANKLKARARREAFLEHARAGHTRDECIAHAGWRSYNTYQQNRLGFPEWARDVDAALGFSVRHRQRSQRSSNSHHGKKNVYAIQVYAQQEDFIAKLKEGLSVADACAVVGWKPNTYYKSRTRDEQFRQTADDILAARTPPGAPEPPRNERTGELWHPGMGFVGFRKVFLHHDSPWFHLQAIEAIHDMIGTGSSVANDIAPVLLILWPPGHGKSSLYEDYDIFRISTDPGVRITIGSEKLTQAKKFLSLVRDKLDNGAAGMELLHRKFGPFAPQPRKPGAKQRVARQRWGSEAFDVFKKPRGRDGERDPTMQALGMGSGITGTRTTILQVDDPQSRESLRKKGNTEGLVDSFRQDWLSRPLADGITVILMNRVGEGDFPQYLMEETNLVDRVIKVKAWDPARGGWAWPERYSQEFYMGKRRQVGEDAWQRNYQQVGLANRDATFTDKLIAQSRNKLRSIMHPVPRPPSGMESEIVIALDPGQFKASFQVFAFHPERLLSLDLRLLENAKSYGVFGDVVDELCQQFHRPGLSVVTTVIVETKAFQYGLVTDPVMVDASRRWGFQIIPFQTGKEKNDPDFGVPRIARMMEHHEIDFPDSDQASRERYEALYRQLRRWRPGVLGKVQEMDHVMTTYFGSHHWNLRRRTLEAAMNTSAFNFGRR